MPRMLPRYDSTRSEIQNFSSEQSIFFENGSISKDYLIFENAAVFVALDAEEKLVSSIGAEHYVLQGTRITTNLQIYSS